MPHLSLPVAIPIYGDVEAIEIAPLIENRENCITVKKTIYNICACLFCMIVCFAFFVYLFFIL